MYNNVNYPLINFNIRAVLSISVQNWAINVHCHTTKGGTNIAANGDQ